MVAPADVAVVARVAAVAVVAAAVGSATTRVVGAMAVVAVRAAVVRAASAGLVPRGPTTRHEFHCRDAPQYMRRCGETLVVPAGAREPRRG